MKSYLPPPNEISIPVATVSSGVERYVGASFCVFLLLIGGIVWISVRNLARMQSAISWVDHTHDEIEMLDEIELNVREAEAALRRYLLFREPAALDDYRKRGLSEIESHIQALRKLTGKRGAADQRHQLDEYEMLVRQRVVTLERFRLSVQGGSGETLRQKDISLTGTQLTEKIAAAFEDFSERERRLLEKGIATREADARFAIFTVTLSGLMGRLVLRFLTFCLEFWSLRGYRRIRFRLGGYWSRRHDDHLPALVDEPHRRHAVDDLGGCEPKFQGLGDEVAIEKDRHVLTRRLRNRDFDFGPVLGVR